MQEILARHPEARIKVFAMWTPILAGDSRRSAVNATAYLPDSRAEHYWDTWSFLSRTYTQQFRYRENGVKETAWDIFVVYEPDLVWRNGPPVPTLWLQNRGLSHGTKYNPGLLESELSKWF